MNGGGLKERAAKCRLLLDKGHQSRGLQGSAGDGGGGIFSKLCLSPGDGLEQQGAEIQPWNERKMKKVSIYPSIYLLNK